MTSTRGVWLRLAIGAFIALVLAAPRFADTASAAAAQTLVGVWKVYPPGWNLVAGPAGSHLAPHGETAFTLDASAAQYLDQGRGSAHAGEGYWVNYPLGAMLMLMGVAQEVTAVHVEGGHWALLGNSGARSAVVRGADDAYVYDPLAGWSTARAVQPGQAALVYVRSAADVYMDPYAPYQPPFTPLLAQLPPGTPPPALPNTGTATALPTDELAYLIALAPLLTDVDDHLGNFADNVDTADPSTPTAPVWQSLRDDATALVNDATTLAAIPVPARYLDVHTALVSALRDLADGMSDTVAGLLGGDDQRVTLGAGLLQSGARRLTDAETQLPS